MTTNVADRRSKLRSALTVLLTLRAALTVLLTLRSATMTPCVYPTFRPSYHIQPEAFSAAR